MSQDRDVKPGDVEIVKIWLYSDDGQREYNLAQQVTKIDIYESILTPCIYGEIMINDSNDLLRQFPILTEEYVEIEFKLPNAEVSSFYKLHVKAIEDLKAQPQQKTKTYKLSLVSMEMVNNAKTRVDKRFGGYKDKKGVLHGSEIHHAVQEIIRDYLKSEKPYDFEVTKGIDELLVTRIQPFRAIDLMRRRAISRKYYSSSFCFFENKRGYVFSTLERLFFMGKDIIGDKIFWTDTNTGNDVAQNKFRNIIGHKQVQFADSISRINQGGFFNRVGVLDIVTGKYKTIEYDDSKDQDKFKSIEGPAIGQNSSWYTNEHTDKTAKTLFMLQDTSRAESFVPEKVAILQSYAQKITQNLVQVHLWGDNLITAGDVIKCYFPSATGTTEKDKKEDRLASGNYLIAKMRHMIQNGNQPKYTMSCELIKGGMFEAA